MYKVLLRRLLILIPQLIAISLFIFILASFMPGDALSGLIDPNLTMAEIERMREELGLNNPWYVQYWDWITSFVRGDFGQSTAHHRPVIDIVGERLFNTFWLGSITLVLTYMIAIPLGVLAGKHSGRWIDRLASLYAFTSLAMPSIVMGILMMFWFSPVGLGWFPLSGTVDVMVVATGDPLAIFVSRIHHMMLPAITGALVSVVGIFFTLRANIIDRKNSDYVNLARSKGVPTRVIFNKHILRNSLVPVAANLGIIIAGIFLGSVFIERVFHFQGVGTLFLDSILRRDFPVANFIIMFSAFLTATGVLLSDIILTLVDPRIRIE